MKMKHLMALGVVVFVSVFLCFQSALAEGEAPQAREVAEISTIPGVSPDAAIAADGTAEGVVVIRESIEDFNIQPIQTLDTDAGTVSIEGSGSVQTETTVTTLPIGEDAGTVSIGTREDIGSVGLIEPYSPDTGDLAITTSDSITPEMTIPTLPDVGDSGSQTFTGDIDLNIGSQSLETLPITAPTGQVATNIDTAATITMTTTVTPAANAKGAEAVQNAGSNRSEKAAEVSKSDENRNVPVLPVPNKKK